MAGMPIGMDRPPLPAPEIQSQMGAGPPPEAQPGLSMVKSNGPGPMGNANPHGFLMAQGEAVKKVLEQMSSTEPNFAPFAQKAIEVISTGVSAVSAAPKVDAPPGSGPGGMPPLG